jgi:hypothetical protein
VYRHGIRQLHPFKRGAWSDEECALLAELVQKLGKKWSAIQSKLNRSADSCRDKHREMSDEFVKGRWKENDTEMLKRVIREQVSRPCLVAYGLLFTVCVTQRLSFAVVPFVFRLTRVPTWT